MLLAAVPSRTMLRHLTPLLPALRPVCSPAHSCKPLLLLWSFPTLTFYLGSQREAWTE